MGCCLGRKSNDESTQKLLENVELDRDGKEAKSEEANDETELLSNSTTPTLAAPRRGNATKPSPLDSFPKPSSSQGTDNKMIDASGDVHYEQASNINLSDVLSEKMRSSTDSIA